MPSRLISIVDCDYKISADHRDAHGQYSYGLFLEKGVGVPCDVSEADRYYKMPVDKGNADAHYKFGLCLER